MQVYFLVKPYLESLVLLRRGGLLRVTAQHGLHVGDKGVAVEATDGVVVVLQPGEEQCAAPRLVLAHSSVDGELVLVPVHHVTIFSRLCIKTIHVGK